MTWNGHAKGDMKGDVVITQPPCGCARGWMCAAHDEQPFAHDACAASGEPCGSALCPYWLPLAGERLRLALDAAIQFEQPIDWGDSGTRH